MGSSRIARQHMVMGDTGQGRSAGASLPRAYVERVRLGLAAPLSDYLGDLLRAIVLTVGQHDMGAPASERLTDAGGSAGDERDGVAIGAEQSR